MAKATSAFPCGQWLCSAAYCDVDICASNDAAGASPWSAVVDGEFRRKSQVELAADANLLAVVSQQDTGMAV